MLRSNTPYSQLLDDSQQVLALLRSRADASLAVRAMLDHYQALHTQLLASQQASEHALSSWRAALSHRWACEIAAQRMATQVIRQLRQHYGHDALLVHAIACTSSQHAGAASDLLEAIAQMHAVLRLIQPDCLPCARLDQLEAACRELARAVQETHQCETSRREALLEHRLAQQACLHAMATAQRVLHAAPPAPIAWPRSHAACEQVLEYA